MNLPHIPGYEFEELIGEGGCGAVYRCRYEDGSLRAVKILNGMAINPGLLSHALTTASSLPEDQGLIPVYTYNLGQTPYYYATHFYGAEGVGEPATITALMGKMKSNQAWRLIEQLISALALLHKNDVVHTSVKPSNIFVEHADEEAASGGFRLRLSDFGQGLVAGLHYYELGQSGYYASPEQLTNGDFSHGKGKRWDVYSFGVVAFQLLTGRLPRLSVRYKQFLIDQKKTKDQTAMLQQEDPISFFDNLQQEPDVVWPSKPKNQYEGQLRDVIDRCLALDPANRPVDLREVARAFENIRHEADLGSVRNQHKAQIRGRNMKINVLMLATGIFVLCSALLAVGALIGFTKYTAKAVELGQAEQKRISDLKEQDRIFQEKIAFEERQRKEAQTETAIRRQQAAHARGFLKFSQENGENFFDLIAKFKDVDFPGYQQARRGAMGKAEQYFERFREEHANDDGYTLSLAKCDLYIAEIRYAQGRLTDAVREYRKALASIDGLELSGDEAYEMKSLAAEVERTLAEIELVREDKDGAIAAWKRSSERFAKLHEMRPSEQTLFEQLKNQFQGIELKIAQGKVIEALKEMGSVGAQLQDLNDTNPDVEAYQLLYARVLLNSGILLRKTRKIDGARQMFSNAARLFGLLIQDNGQVEDYQYYWAICLNQEGNILRNADKLQDAITLLENVAKLNPANHRYRFQLAYSYGSLAAIQRDEGQTEQALELNNLAIEVLEDLLQMEPDIPSYNSALAKQWVELGELNTDTSKYDDAAKLFERGIEVFDELLSADAKNDEYLTIVAKAQGNLGFIRHKQGNTALAKVHYLKAQEVWTTVLDLVKDDKEATEGLAWIVDQIKRAK